MVWLLILLITTGQTLGFVYSMYMEKYKEFVLYVYSIYYLYKSHFYFLLDVSLLFFNSKIKVVLLWPTHV